MTTQPTKTPPGGRTHAKASLTASAAPARRRSVDEFRREQADRAIARIEDAYRRGLAIPDVR